MLHEKTEFKQRKNWSKKWSKKWYAQKKIFDLNIFWIIKWIMKYESYKMMLQFTLQCYQELVVQSIWLLGHLSGTFLVWIFILIWLFSDFGRRRVVLNGRRSGRSPDSIWKSGRLPIIRFESAGILLKLFLRSIELARDRPEWYLMLKFLY